jgi:hypothetical protein
MAKLKKAKDMNAYVVSSNKSPVKDTVKDYGADFDERLKNEHDTRKFYSPDSAHVERARQYAIDNKESSLGTALKETLQTSNIKSKKKKVKTNWETLDKPVNRWYNANKK